MFPRLIISNREKITLVALALILAGCASTGVVSTGPDTYMIARTGSSTGSPVDLTAELYREANPFCAEQKKQLITINVRELNAIPFVRMASSKLEFRCVAQGDPAAVAK